LQTCDDKFKELEQETAQLRLDLAEEREKSKKVVADAVKAALMAAKGKEDEMVDDIVEISESEVVAIVDPIE